MNYLNNSKVFDYSHAISSLYPNCQWSIIDNDLAQLWWHKDNGCSPPNKEELEEEIQRLKIEWEKTEYQRIRGPEYPSLADFADAYYWAQKGDNTKMDEYILKCDEVKEKYPKT